MQTWTEKRSIYGLIKKKFFMFDIKLYGSFLFFDDRHCIKITPQRFRYVS